LDVQKRFLARAGASGNVTRAAAGAAGMARSLAIYYGVPLRGRRIARLYAGFIGDGALCFDIGAHAGNHIRCWRRLGAKVVAVEPQALFFALLERLYGHDPCVTLIRAAVGSRTGNATLWVSDRSPTVTTLSPQWAARVAAVASFRNVRWRKGSRVATITLESLIEHYGMPAFVKIDVEGYEQHVLEGLSTPIPALSFECIPAARAGALACVDRLCALGRYRFNWSAGESFELAQRWLDADGIRALIAGLDDRARSGDVYARLDVARRHRRI
jgi:FkbM family methyltransferase